MVNRYKIWPYDGCEKDAEGEWVTYSDYEKLKSERDALKAELQQTKIDWLDRCKRFRKKDYDEHQAALAAKEG